MIDPTPTSDTPDHDGHWKEALHDYLEPCLRLFWPGLHRKIDFGSAPVFLDKELQRLGGARRRGRRLVDKLVRLRLRAGGETLLLLHLEVQARDVPDFGERMFVYHYRLRERHPREPLVQAAILTRSATCPGMGMSTYRYLPLDDGAHGSLEYRFPVVHLVGWARERPDLHHEARHNPFAVVVLAEMDAARLRAPGERLARKIALVRLLHERGYGAEDVRRLFTFIDGVLMLAPQHEPAFLAALEAIEGEHQVAYITSVERAGIRKGVEMGRADGMRQLLQAQLEQRFGRLPAEAARRIDAASPEDLQRWSLRLLRADSLDEVLDKA